MSDVLEREAAAGETLAAALRLATRRLAAAGIEEPRREARLLLATALGTDTTTILLYPERVLGAAEASRFAHFVARRAAREPAARLLGRREFWSLDFALSPATLIPRPDSETLIEAALEAVPDRGTALRILDFGTGTGCLLLALLTEFPAATGIGVDIAPEAVVTAQRNARSLELAERARFIAGFWGDAIGGPENLSGFDVIIANPPYIMSAAIAELAPEVAKFEPIRALDGGADGLAAYRRLVREVGRLLKPTGFALFEVGAGQSNAVARIVEQSGLVVRGARRDLAGIERCVVLGKSIA